MCGPDPTSALCSHLDAPGVDPRLIDGLRIGRRATLHRAILEAVARPVQRALDAAIDQLALVQCATAVAAAVGKHVDRPVAANDHEVEVADGRRRRRSRGELCMPDMNNSPSSSA